MANNFIQPGNTLDYTASSDIVSGQVVAVGNLLGVAAKDIATGQTGSVHITGVFKCPKVSAAVINQGEPLTWDASAGAFDDSAATPATGDITGPPAVAFAAAGNGETEMRVKFTGVPGTVT